MKQFAMNLLRQVPYTSNALLSPASVTAVLLRNAIGAAGNTRTEMVRVLGLPQNISDEQLLRNAVLVEQLLQQAHVNVANRLYLESDYILKQGFLRLASQNGGIEQMPFSSKPEGSRQEINTWVWEKTAQRIQNLLPEGSIDSMTKMVLVNALHLKLNWVYMFEEAETHMMQFNNMDGSIPQAWFMTQKNDNLLYMYGHRVSALVMPYQDTNMFRLYVVPHDGVSLAEVEADLFSNGFRQLMDQMNQTKGLTIYLPKFELEYGTENLTPYLMAMGMRDAFGNAADFSNMEIGGTKSLHISGVYHKTWMRDDEFGSEMAAATAAVTREKAVSRSPVFSADRPFLFYNLIPVGSSFIPVFAGRYVNATQARITQG